MLFTFFTTSHIILTYGQEASAQLTQYCNNNESRYAQMSAHIERYIERASEIQRDLLKQRAPSNHSNVTGEANFGPHVDANAQRQLQDMGLTAGQARDALM
jgi:hypothetical protein